ncbi:craniofacial development protein 2-like [Patiria miniata]|uniref:Uncharacterized protein n=1 Tax=Patiria miniata TaxID=46514 RepID=A0A914BA33_PATMI|nr:craniofacial development protein 2-like [Patiria miniata]
MELLVISCTPVSSRLISIRILARPHNMTIIQVSVPTSDNDDEEVEEVYICLGLLEFAKSHRLTLANTRHPHHKLFRTASTWHSPNAQTHNQIDFILVPQRFKFSVNKANKRTFLGADIGSEHDLVLPTFTLKLKVKRCPREPPNLL